MLRNSDHQTISMRELLSKYRNQMQCSDGKILSTTSTVNPSLSTPEANQSNKLALFHLLAELLSKRVTTEVLAT